jgi:predicted MPP superfamily phosphohydrolase
MFEYLLLRFRDLPHGDQKIFTIKKHNDIAAKGEGRVIWGWWKKPPELTPDPGLSIFKQELRPGEPRVIFIDSSFSPPYKLYHAPLYEVFYEPGGIKLPCPDKSICPEYYHSETLPAWFKIGRIEEGLPPGFNSLSEFVWSHRNRTEPKSSATALSEKAINQAVTDTEFLDSNVSLWLITPTRDIGLRDRGDLVRAQSDAVWHAPGRYAVHLSDLHFGDQHEFRNQLSTGPALARESLLEALLGDIALLRLTKSIALVLVTGDLTWKGDPHEFSNAANFFEVLCRHLGLHRSQVVIVPGNHDIEWRAGSEGVDPNAELNYRNFIAGFYGIPPGDSMMRMHQFILRDANNLLVRIIGLNTCRLESKDNAGLGFVGRDQIKEFNNLLQGSAPAQGELRIALGHHHFTPVNYVESIDWEKKRVSIMLDADGVLRNLLYSHVRLILHGHQHQPYLSEVRRVIDRFTDPCKGEEMLLDRTTAIVGGGSVGVARHHLNVIGRHSYNIIDLGYEKDPAQFQVRVRVQSADSPSFSDHQRAVFNV